MSMEWNNGRTLLQEEASGFTTKRLVNPSLTLYSSLNSWLWILACHIKLWWSCYQEQVNLRVGGNTSSFSSSVPFLLCTVRVFNPLASGTQVGGGGLTFGTPAKKVGYRSARCFQVFSS